MSKPDPAPQHAQRATDACAHAAGLPATTPAAMPLLNLTLCTYEENLALDEALLEEAEVAEAPREVLRLWQPVSYGVVLGRSSMLHEEVHADRCAARGVPVVRRVSGGASIVAGPGCLMYSLVLSYQLRPELRSIDVAHRFVLGMLSAALSRRVPGVRCRGTSDLVLGDVKFSGNSVRCRRKHMLYHGTLLHDFPLTMISEFLREPPRQPEYRRGRPHQEFVTNLPLAAAEIEAALIDVWQASPADGWPRERTTGLVQNRYRRTEWNETGR
ncbi:MAG: lipoate--protein ligase family protein [Planctomycetota bacterium]